MTWPWKTGPVELTAGVPAGHVPEAFRARVELELREARRRALDVMPLPVVTIRRIGSRWGPEQAQTVRRSTLKRCVACSCPHDEETRGCRVCRSRHLMRALGRRRAALTAVREERYAPAA